MGKRFEHTAGPWHVLGSSDKGWDLGPLDLNNLQYSVAVGSGIGDQVLVNLSRAADCVNGCDAAWIVEPSALKKYVESSDILLGMVDSIRASGWDHNAYMRDRIDEQCAEVRAYLRAVRGE